MNKRVIIIGYYGANNMGDEAILTGMIHALRQQGIKHITVLSRQPEQTRQIHGVDSLYIGRKWDGLGRIYQELTKTDVCILGGGGLLQDYSTRVVPYWLSRVFLAFLARTPVVYYAQGIGPLRTTTAKRLVRLFSNRVKWITVRDEASAQLLQDVGVRTPSIEVTADPALGMSVPTDGEKYLMQEGIPLDSYRRTIGISLRPWNGAEDFLPVLTQGLERLYRNNKIRYVFLPFQYGEDEAISRRVMHDLMERGCTECYCLQDSYVPEQMAAITRLLDGVLAMRLHALILSAISHVPLFGLVYDPKVRRFMERAEQDKYAWDLEQLVQAEEEFYLSMQEWIEQRAEIQQHMKQPIYHMVQQSARNAERVYELLEQ